MASGFLGWVHSNGNESWADNPVKTGGLRRQNIDGMTKLIRSKKLTTEKKRVGWTKDLMINWKWSNGWRMSRETEQRTVLILNPRNVFLAKTRFNWREHVLRNRDAISSPDMNLPWILGLALSQQRVREKSKKEEIQNVFEMQSFASF